jgi:hypothetical protein
MLRRASPTARGLTVGALVDHVGRAARFDAGKVEVWRLGRGDEAAAEQLASLGAEHVGGFTDAGVDGEGVWLARAPLATSLADRFRTVRGPMALADALAIALPIARALDVVERSGLALGPLSLDAISIATDGTISLRADALARSLVGAPADPRATQSLSARWVPPAQADGAAWDAAACRYVLGLVLYRALSGEHPFGGAGLRHALDAARTTEAPPFNDAIARALPAGLMSLCLRLLHPNIADRPASAALVVTDLEAFAGVRRAVERPSVTKDRPSKVEARARATTPKSSVDVAPGPSSWLARLWPIGVGALVAGASLMLLGPAPVKPVADSPAPPAPPITASQTHAQDCATCHPRQAAEWRRSVMAHSVKSPLFNALESAIEEQVGRSNDCPNGGGILRKVGGDACVARTGVAITGSGGEHWCVNCHSPGDNLGSQMPAWSAHDGNSKSRLPVRDLIGDRAIEGISCGFCHAVHGPVSGRGGGYQGNPTWTSFLTGNVFPMRPEDQRGLFGIANSGYVLAPNDELLTGPRGGASDLPAHKRPTPSAKSYLATSEFCGACHDVRLFGTDSFGAAKGERFKRLRNAYSEYVSWADGEKRAGRKPATCQGCHMSEYPGRCEPGVSAQGQEPECPNGTHFVARPAGSYARGGVANSSAEDETVTTHYFSGVDVPLARELDPALIDEPTVDAHGIPLSARKRRDLLLRHTFRFELDAARRAGSRLEIPLTIENVGAGHRVPAGFSQEREFWVHLVVRDARGGKVYEVGRVDRADEDLHDRVMERVNVGLDQQDGQGQPLGVFGADVRDGIDVPEWSPPPVLGGSSFRGKGLINFQNGFLRCVTCIGELTPDGRCLPRADQTGRRADRFADGNYDLDTGECRSNLTGLNAFLETYFPIGALDASRGVVKGPDAIIDTRSLPPRVPVRYTYDLPLPSGARGPFTVEARLMFRAFPPYLIRGFAAYEREMARRGQRPSGPLMTDDMLGRLELVELAHAAAEVR